MKAAFTGRLAKMALLGACLLAAPCSAATTVLLNANFNDKPLNAPIGTGGPGVGEPIFVGAAMDAKVRATPGPTRSLHIGKISGTAYDLVVFEFPGSSEIVDGDLRVSFSVRAPTISSNFQFGVREQGNSASNFGTLLLNAAGNVIASDAAGTYGVLRTYAPDETLVIEYLFHLEARTYELRINNVLLMNNRSHGVANMADGIGRLFVATNQTDKWIVDDIIVIHTTSESFPGSEYGSIPDGLTNVPGSYGAARDIRFEVSGLPGTVSGAGVSFSAAHTWVGQLRVRLIGPNGKQHLLFARTGATTATGTGYLGNLRQDSTYDFRDSNVTNWWTAAEAPANIPSANSRTVIAGGAGVSNPPPVTSINASFAATPVNGTWILRFEDGHSASFGSVTAATLTLGSTGVTRVVSSINNSGAGSLREAMTLATKGDLIAFDPVLFGTPQTIELLSALPDIGLDMAIEGPGANLLTVRRRDDVSNFRIFHVSAASANVAISGMTISNGNSTSGGGIRSTGNLTLSRVEVSGNAATFEGGGLSLLRNGFIHASTIAGNTAGQGGGIAYEGPSGGTLRLYDSTVSGNRAGKYGGVYHFGLNTGTSSLEIVNNTIAYNTANAESGGIGTYTESSASVATTTLRNSIVANNAPNNVYTDASQGGMPSNVSSGYNLSDNWNGLTLATTDVTGNPRLGPLAPQGGTTPTHLLLGGSAALDKGNRSGAASDQRGVNRAFDIASIANPTDSDGADIGAVEMQAIIITTSSDTGVGSLREAMTSANANGVGLDDIIFDNTLFASPITIPVATELPVIASAMTLSGPSAKQLTVRRNDGAASFHMFEVSVEGHSRVAISGISIRNGGEGIIARSDLTLAEIVLADTGGEFGYGGLSAIRCNVFIIGSTISGNLDEGGISILGNDGHAIFVINSTISGNTGGGIRNVSSSGSSRLEVINSTVANGSDSSAAIFTGTLGSGSSATTVMRNSIFANNSGANFRAVSSQGGGPVTYISRGFNLADDNSGAFLNQSTDQNNANAGLLPLADNGGPTYTHALTNFSDALDGGNNSGSGVTAGQRGPGYARTIDLPLTNVPGGDGTDVGAFEVQSDPDRIFANGFE